MPTKRRHVTVYLDNDEKARLDALASQLRLSRSDLFRRLIMNYHIPKAEDFVAWQGIRDLLKVNADQARLGNLFKLALDETADGQLTGRLDELAREIAQTQDLLKAAAMDVRKVIGHGNSRHPE